MPDASDIPPVGVCIVRAEHDASAGMLITVSTRLDVEDAASEAVLTTATPNEAVVRLKEFLAEWSGF
jgi:hypothetical protein